MLEAYNFLHYKIFVVVTPSGFVFFSGVALFSVTLAKFKGDFDLGFLEVSSLLLLFFFQGTPSSAGLLRSGPRDILGGGMEEASISTDLWEKLESRSLSGAIPLTAASLCFSTNCFRSTCYSGFPFSTVCLPTVSLFYPGSTCYFISLGYLSPHFPNSVVPDYL